MARGDKLPRAERWFVLGVKSVMEGRQLTKTAVAEMAGGGASYLTKVLKEEPPPKGKPLFRWRYAEAVAEAAGSDLQQVLTIGRDIAEAEDAKASTTEESMRSLIQGTKAEDLRRFRDMINRALGEETGEHATLTDV